MRSGHAVADGSGRLVSVDDDFGVILRAAPSALVGRTVLEITAPADRAECGACLARLADTRAPFEIVKRFVCDDGALVWVRNAVSFAHGADGGHMVVATVTPITDTSGERAPAQLLDSARTLAAFHEDRTALFDPALLSSTGWSAVLSAYIAEAEGRAVTVTALARKLAISIAQANRWIDALIRADMVEIETRECDPHAPKSFVLTASAHRRLEGHLERAGARFAATRPPAVQSVRH